MTYFSPWVYHGNKETLKQKQVAISIFTVICITLTTRIPGQNKKGFGGINFYFPSGVVCSNSDYSNKYHLHSVFIWAHLCKSLYCQFRNLTLVAILGLRSLCSQQGKAGAVENTSDGFPHILETNTKTHESKLRCSKCSSASNHRHHFFSLRIKAMLL